MTIKQCSPCTACCEGWLSADIGGEIMKPGKPCIHSTKQGCGIYETRPENPCVLFSCGWLKDQNKMPENMKPSECGAIVIFDRPWHDRSVIRAIPTGAKIPDDTLEWLKALSREKSLPLLFIERLVENGAFIGSTNIGYGPASFIHAVQYEVGPEDVVMY